MLKKLLSVAFPKRLSTAESIGTHKVGVPERGIEEFPTPSQKPNFVGEELAFYPLLDAIKVLVDDIIARFPLPPSVQYPDDDDYDYECAEAIAMRSKYVRDRVAAERAQAKAAHLAAANQYGKGGAQIAAALTEWAAAKEAGALAVERS